MRYCEKEIKNADNPTSFEVSKVAISRIGLPLPYYGHIAYIFYFVILVFVSGRYVGDEFNNVILITLAIVIFFCIRYVVLLDAYPKKLGCLKITPNEIFFPGCIVSSTEAEVVKFEQIKEIIVYYNLGKRRLGAPLYIEFCLNTGDVVGINCILVDINRLKTVLENNNYNNVKIIKIHIRLYFALFLGALSFLIILLTAFYR